MNRYKVMLVDDEEDVAQAIMKKMDWENMGFEKPRYAHNGLEALEFAEEQRPDIVMSDIKMPYMDGMELARNLKQLYPNIRIIFFSGFDEFQSRTGIIYSNVLIWTKISCIDSDICQLNRSCLP